MSFEILAKLDSYIFSLLSFHLRANGKFKLNLLLFSPQFEANNCGGKPVTVLLVAIQVVKVINCGHDVALRFGLARSFFTFLLLKTGK